jgi:uncharacterized LabA/DUF88 family protein
MAKPRVYVAVDVSNLWKSCQEKYGGDARVDFLVLGEMIPSLFSEPVQQKLVAYIVTTPRQRHRPFVSVLRSFGFRVKQRFMRRQKGLEKPLNTDWDVGITVDAVSRIDQYDTFVLASGDGDFSLLLEFLRDRGKQTIVLTFPNNVATSLYSVANQLVPLNHSVVIL